VEILYRYFFERLYLLAAGEHVIRKPEVVTDELRRKPDFRQAAHKKPSSADGPRENRLVIEHSPASQLGAYLFRRVLHQKSAKLCSRMPASFNSGMLLTKSEAGAIQRSKSFRQEQHTDFADAAFDQLPRQLVLAGSRRGRRPFSIAGSRTLHQLSRTGLIGEG
jgi:hypothetical protein